MKQNEKVPQDPAVSVVIPLYNSDEHILRCLQSIFRQQVPFEFEVIIIDSSDHDLSPMIKKEFSSVRFYHLEGRVYPGSARNIGVSYAKGKIIAFTDSDCLVAENWLDEIYRHFQNGEKKIIGGSIYNGYGSHLIATGEYLMEFGEFLPKKKAGIVEMVPSCNFAIQKELFEKADGFSDFITAEDVMFSHKLNRMGEKIYFDPGIGIHHFNRRNFLTFLTKQKELGIGSCVLRRTIKIRGNQLTKFRLMALLVPPIRIYTVWKKVLLNDFSYILNLIVTFPFMFAGLLAYGYGFWLGFSYPVASIDDKN